MRVLVKEWFTYYPGVPKFGNMRLERIAIWVDNLELMKEFYETYFNGGVGDKYTNVQKNFQSYFISFSGGARIEMMHQPPLVASHHAEINKTRGYAHLAMSLGSKAKVNEMTERFRSDGFNIVGEPRTTGDGYYESVILDPEGNRIELTV
jgi:lactoylglutathione lyase